MAKDTKKENPLLSKNIPRPPTAPESHTEMNKAKTVEQENGKTGERQNDTTVERENGIITEGQKAKTVEEQNGRTVREQSNNNPIEEKATIELSLYLRPSHDDKLDELQRVYKKRTGKRIHRNDIMRILIERATIEDLL